MKLHPDWPEHTDRWQSGDPHSELESAFNDSPQFYNATAPATNAEGFALDDIARITDYFISSDGGNVWAPGGDIYSELDAVMVGELKDGRWFSVTMSNDYTGWGCQSGSDWRIGPTKGAIYQYGLGERDRVRLHLPPVSA